MELNKTNEDKRLGRNRIVSGFNTRLMPAEGEIRSSLFIHWLSNLTPATVLRWQSTRNARSCYLPKISRD